MRNFTAFAAADLQFSDGLNVFVGENGVGKTHLLKLPYAVLAASATQAQRMDGRPTKRVLQPRLAEKLVNVLRPDSLGRLARRQRGRQRCEVKLVLTDRAQIAFNFATQSKSEVVLEKTPSSWLPTKPVFLPTRELLSIYPGFSALYDGRHLEFEETWRDTCQLLGSPTVREHRSAGTRALLVEFEQLMGGSLVLDRTGRFYLRTRDGKVEMPLVAEGVRKLGMLARLLATGSLVGSSILFWDEPETNLNPRLIKGVAEAMLRIAKQGVQVFVATHSLFLLREFEVLHDRPDLRDTRCRYFALAPKAKIRMGGEDVGVTVQQDDELAAVDPLMLLDEDLEQSARYLDSHA